jgi:hypothetical protein
VPRAGLQILADSDQRIYLSADLRNHGLDEVVLGTGPPDREACIAAAANAGVKGRWPLQKHSSDVRSTGSG